MFSILHVSGFEKIMPTVSILTQPQPPPVAHCYIASVLSWARKVLLKLKKAARLNIRFAELDRRCIKRYMYLHYYLPGYVKTRSGQSPRVLPCIKLQTALVPAGLEARPGRGAGTGRHGATRTGAPSCSESESTGQPWIGRGVNNYSIRQANSS